MEKTQRRASFATTASRRKEEERERRGEEGGEKDYRREEREEKERKQERKDERKEEWGDKEALDFLLSVPLETYQKNIEGEKGEEKKDRIVNSTVRTHMHQKYFSSNILSKDFFDANIKKNFLIKCWNEKRPVHIYWEEGREGKERKEKRGWRAPYRSRRDRIGEERRGEGWGGERKEDRKDEKRDLGKGVRLVTVNVSRRVNFQGFDERQGSEISKNHPLCVVSFVANDRIIKKSDINQIFDGKQVERRQKAKLTSRIAFAMSQCLFLTGFRNASRHKVKGSKGLMSAPPISIKLRTFSMASLFASKKKKKRFPSSDSSSVSIPPSPVIVRSARKKKNVLHQKKSYLSISLPPIFHEFFSFSLKKKFSNAQAPTSPLPSSPSISPPLPSLPLPVLSVSPALPNYISPGLNFSPPSHVSPLPPISPISPLPSLSPLPPSKAQKTHTISLMTNVRAIPNCFDSFQNKKKKVSHNLGISYQALLTTKKTLYNPYLFVRPRLEQSSNMTEMLLPSYSVSILSYSKEETQKKELNELFRQNHLWLPTEMTYTKIQNLKKDLFAIYEREKSLFSPFVIGCACVYLERLLSDGFVKKENRKIISCCCFILALKFLEGDENRSLRSLLSVISNFFQKRDRNEPLSLRDIISTEFDVFVALKFDLHVEMHHVMPHIKQYLSLS